METTTTATATSLDEFDPLDDPQVREVYENIKKQHGQIAAERYLLTVKPTDGMTATTPPVTTRDRNQGQQPSRTTLRTPERAPSPPPVPTDTGRSLPTDAQETAGVETVKDATPDSTTGAASGVRSTPPEGVTTAVRETAETPEAPPNELTDTAPESVALDAPIPETDSPLTAVSRTSRPPRKPTRSTAQVKQAFEAALAEFVAGDKPFKRTHVLAKAGLGAGFYQTYPSLRTKVDQAIANVGKPKPQPEAAPVTPTPAETETTAPAEAEPPVSQEVAEPPLTDPDPVNVNAGQLTTTQGTTLSHDCTPVAGLTWGNMSGLAAHWRDEQARLKQAISQLLVELDTATENAEAYERVLSLHSTGVTGETHGQ